MLAQEKETEDGKQEVKAPHFLAWLSLVPLSS